MRPGFADPVLDAQRCFRAAMEAMARPGRVQRVQPPTDLPPGLHGAAAALMLALTDAETPCWTDAGEEARAWLGFHTGAPSAPAAEAEFLLATAAMPALATLRAGTDEAPQEGATLIVQLPALDGGAAWRLTGPGIEHAHALAPRGLPEDFAAQWAASRARFPRGVDLFLAAGDALAALPRTTRVEVA